MSVIDRITALFSPKKFNSLVTEAVKRELDTVHTWLGHTADAQRWELPSWTAYFSQADMYRLSPILGTAMDVLGDDVGLTDISVKRRVGEEIRDVVNHEFEYRVYGSIAYPNPLETKKEFLKATSIGYKLNGNHVWWLNRASWSERPDEMWTIPFENIKPIPDGQLYIKGYNYYPGNGKEAIQIPTWQVVHFKTYNPHNRFVGLSPLESLAETIVGNLGKRKTSARQYTEYGGAPQSILSFKDWISDDVFDDVQRAVRNAAMRNEMVILRGVGEGGAAWQSRTVSSREAEFIEGLQQDMVDVFNRMAPGLLAMLDPSANRSNAKEARATYSDNTLYPMLVEISSKINSEIMPAYGRNLFVEFDDPRQADTELELKVQQQYALTHTVDEINEKFYQGEPLGDERGKLFPVQINAQIGDGTKPMPVPQQLQPFQQGNVQPPTDEEGEDEQSEMDEGTKAALSDLEKWRRIALRKKNDKAFSFTSRAIPLAVMQGIKARLKAADSKEDIAALFDAQAERMKPKPHNDPMVVLRAIEAGVRAMENRR